MKFARALMRVAVVAAPLLVAGMLACGEDPKGPSTLKPPSKAQLIGSYTCYRFIGYYKGSEGTGYYAGSCVAYARATNPSRADSIEVQDFQVMTSFGVTRPDFEQGTFVYDSANAQATINYSTDRPSEVYEVWVPGANFLTRTFVPFDYTGDGLIDSLTLTYQKVF